MPATGPDKPDLSEASDTDEVHRLAYELAAWGLRNGECDEYDAVDWVLGHPHESSLPRGSSGRPNVTRHHITKGAEAAVAKFEPWVFKAAFDPEPLHTLADRVSGSGALHERYLLGAIALCHRFETLTPVITGPLLAGAVGVADPVAGRVLSEWSTTMAGGFFSGVSYDGVRGHGRVWTVDVDWIPSAKPKHLPGCNRSKARCRCPGIVANCRKTGDLSFAAANDRSPKVRQTATARRKHSPGCNRSKARCTCPQPEVAPKPPTEETTRRDTAAEFARWVKPMKPGHRLTVTEVAKRLGVTRASATKLLRAQQGELLDASTAPGGLRQRRDPDTRELRRVRAGESWFRSRPEYGDDMSDETAERLGLI